MTYVWANEHPLIATRSDQEHDALGPQSEDLLESPETMSEEVYDCCACPPTFMVRRLHASPSDSPGLTSPLGHVIFFLRVLLLLSLVTCLSRHDFNFVFYLMGYYIWCIESNDDRERDAYYYTAMLAITCIIDVSWISLGFSTWGCEHADKTRCFNADSIKLLWTYQIHRLVLTSSVCALSVKIFLIIASIFWIRSKKAEDVNYQYSEPFHTSHRYHRSRR